MFHLQMHKRFSVRTWILVSFVATASVAMALACYEIYVKIVSRSRIAQQSSVVHADQRFSIRSLRWRGKQLEVVYVHELMGPFPDMLDVNQPTMCLSCEFLDTQNQRIDWDGTVQYYHEPAFIFGPKRDECVTFILDVPSQAQSVAIQHGPWPWKTRHVLLPDRIVDPILDCLGF